jgi:aspartyl-tRNA(Asn)/glutamyl-tRNA(Gln) amidotransferase subunit C
MQVNKNLVEKLAHLSRLTIAENEMPEVINGLENMIGFVEQLQAIDTSDVQPLMYVGQAMNVFREDEVNDEITQQQALKIAPLHTDEFFEVPTVIKK